MTAFLQNAQKLFQSKLSRYITCWVFLSIVVVEAVILVPSYFRREAELLQQLETTSSEVFTSLLNQSYAEANIKAELQLIFKNRQAHSVILGAAIYQKNYDNLVKIGNHPPSPNFQPTKFSPSFYPRNQPLYHNFDWQNNYYDIAWLLPEGKILVVRHNTADIPIKLNEFKMRIAGLVAIISLFVTLVTMLILGITVIIPILRLRNSLLEVGEAVTKDMDQLNLCPLSLQRQDEIGEVMGAFVQMVERIRQEIRDRKQAESSLIEEQSKSESLLKNIFPVEIAQKLKEQHHTILAGNNLVIANRFDQVTILFADIVGFTSLSARISAIQLVDSLNHIFSCFDRLAVRYGLEKIKTIGDAYMVVGGLPTPRFDHATAIANMALEMQQKIQDFHTDTGEPFQLRIGIHTGSVVAGVIGLKKFSYDLWGDAVNLASRMESQGMVGKIQVSQPTYNLIEDKFQLEKRGIINVKGRGEMTTYFLVGK